MEQLPISLLISSVMLCRRIFHKISESSLNLIAVEVVPEKLRTLDHGRPWRDDQFASTRLSSNRDMSR